MNGKYYGHLSGNRFNLRSKATNQIKRIESLSSVLGALGDFLVTTWGGLIGAIVLIFIGTAGIIAVMTHSPTEILAQNILPAIIIAVGVLLLAINVALTNPVQGYQIKVSSRFLFNKFKNLSKNTRRIKFRPFKFLENDESKTVIVQEYKGKSKYIAAYAIRGVVSPVTFDSDLEYAANADANFLKNNDSNVVVGTIISINKTQVSKKQLPKNATEAMIKKRDLQYNLTHDQPNNQQITTIMTVAGNNLDTLRQSCTFLENAFVTGMVVGYRRIYGKELKKTFKKLFGEG